MPDESTIVIEVIGEGETDLGPPSAVAELADKGVVPIFVRKLCGDPPTLRIKRKRVPFVQGKGGLTRKVQFAKLQAFNNRSAGMVFVVDTEGDDPGKHLDKLRAGRDAKMHDYPAAVGVAHPCIEAWLLAVPGAIAKAMGLPQVPILPEHPELLSAPQHDRKNNPKTVLADCAGVTSPVATKHSWKIAEEIRNFARLRERCPVGFATFADEIEARILPLFGPIAIPEEAQGAASDDPI
jgi:hypothetical protein